MKLFSRQSFTLLEVIIFIAILSIVLVTSASFITRLLFNISLNEHRAVASFLADDVKEWLNSEREATSWSAFHAKASATGNTYCINSELSLEDSIGTLSSMGACSSYSSIYSNSNIPAIYKRELFLRADNARQVTARITVSWIEQGRTTDPSVIVESVYTAPF